MVIPRRGTVRTRYDDDDDDDERIRPGCEEYGLTHGGGGLHGCAQGDPAGGPHADAASGPPDSGVARCSQGRAEQRDRNVR